MGEAHLAQQVTRRFIGIFLRHAANQQRHRHILNRSKLRQQMVKLIDKSQRLIARHATFGFALAANIFAHDKNIAAAGFIQSAQQMQQRAFAGA